MPGKASLDESKRSLLFKRLATVHCRHLATGFWDEAPRSVLYKNVALSIAQQWPPNQMPTFKQLFNELDLQGNGSLQVDHLEKALTARGHEAGDAARATAAMNLSQDKAAIHWTEFVAACR